MWLRGGLVVSLSLSFIQLKWRQLVRCFTLGPLGPGCTWTETAASSPKRPLHPCLRPSLAPPTPGPPGAHLIPGSSYPLSNSMTLGTGSGSGR